MQNQKKAPVGPPDKSKAVFKMIVYLKTPVTHKTGQIQKALTLYNYHTSWNAELGKVIYCERTGLKKLQNHLLWKLKDQFTTALIIHIPTDRIIEKYVYNRLNFALPYTFTYNLKDDAVKIAVETLTKLKTA